MKEICKRCKKHKELAVLKPRLCHDCADAEGKRVRTEKESASQNQ